MRMRRTVEGVSLLVARDAPRGAGMKKRKARSGPDFAGPDRASSSEEREPYFPDFASLIAFLKAPNGWAPLMK